MMEKDLMKDKLKDFLNNRTYIFITVQYSENSKIFFYNGYVKNISNEDIVFEDDKSGEMSVEINIIKSAVPRGER